MPLSITLLPKYHQKTKSNDNKPFIKDMTHSTKLNVSNSFSKPVEPFSPFSFSEEENGGQKDLWGDASTFYGLPEDVCDFEDVKVEEDEVSKLKSFQSQKWNTSRFSISEL